MDRDVAIITLTQDFNVDKIVSTEEEMGAVVITAETNGMLIKYRFFEDGTILFE